MSAETAQLCREHGERLNTVDGILQKILVSCTRLEEGMSDVRAEIKGLKAELEGQKKELVPLTEDRAKAVVRYQRWTNIAWAAVSAATLGILARFGDVIYATLSRPRG